MTVSVSVIVDVMTGVDVEVRVTVGVAVMVACRPAVMEKETCAASGEQPPLLLMIKMLYSPLTRDDLASSQVDSSFVKSGVRVVLEH